MTTNNYKIKPSFLASFVSFMLLNGLDGSNGKGYIENQETHEHYTFISIRLSDTETLIKNIETNSEFKLVKTNFGRLLTTSYNKPILDFKSEGLTIISIELEVGNIYKTTLVGNDFSMVNELTEIQVPISVTLTA